MAPAEDPVPVPPWEWGGMAVNHATVSRADMRGRAIGGIDEVILDMTGQPMVVRRMSSEDMEAAPSAPWQNPADRPVPWVPTLPVREEAAPASSVSYTYGVPAEIAERLSPEQQVLAQPHMVEQREGATTRLRAVGSEPVENPADPAP